MTAVAGLAALALAAGVALGGAGPLHRAGTPAGGPNGSVGADWSSFGGTVDQLRHSSLRQVTKSNVGQLGRVFTLDLRKIDPDIRRGQQSYPVVADGIIYVTSADDSVFAVNGASGTVLWRFKPPNSALFKNFGIVANRGVAVCDGKVFLATLDMRLDSLDRKTGKLVKSVPIANYVPGASSQYGYSNTSPPICYRHRLLLGAAGSDYGVRGFFMAYKTDLTPAWSNPYWTIPPEQQGWRAKGRLVGGGAVWTPSTVDPATNTVYFGTATPSPLYYPDMRPGPNPRTNSLIALDLDTGTQRWWQQQLAHDQWGYSTSQPPLVYTAKVGGKQQRIVSVATKEGVWFAYDARTGRPVYQRVKVINQIEHPALKPGKPVVIYPASIGGVNYSPASFDPSTNYVYNAACETASVLVQQKLSSREAKRNRVLGDIFLGLQNGDFGQYLKGFRDFGSVSAIDIGTGRRVWKQTTPECERGGVTTTATGLAFVGGGDGNLRAFDTKSGKLLWKFQTGWQIASGTSIYSAAGKQYLAITVGGTPTSSNGGTASELQVFALGAVGKESKPPPLPKLSFSSLRAGAGSAAGPRSASTSAPTATPASIRGSTAAAARGGARILLPGHGDLRQWSATSGNYQAIRGVLLLRGRPVRGARVRVDSFVLPARTAGNGAFSYRADMTLPRRHVATVVDASGATVGGKRLTEAERRAVLAARGAFSVSYKLTDLRASVRKGRVVVSGRVSYADGSPPPRVLLYTYQLSGTITDAAGKPVADAVVVTRTLDRDYWTLSRPSDAKGRYTSFFTASDETRDDPVPFSVQVASGDTSYSYPFGTSVLFGRLRSATLDLQLPASGASLGTKPPTSKAYRGGIYHGLLVGVTSGGKPVKPLYARWPDTHGNFELILPGAFRGKTISLFEQTRQVFSRATARPNGPVDLGTWPGSLPGYVPQDLQALRLPR